jgi:hypothetical protein
MRIITTDAVMILIEPNAFQMKLPTQQSGEMSIASAQTDTDVHSHTDRILKDTLNSLPNETFLMVELN